MPRRPQQAARPAFTLCVCPDSHLLRGALADLLAARPCAGGGAWQRVVFWADEGLGASFWEHLTLQGLFAVPKALIVRNAQALPADSLKQLSPVLVAMAAGASGQNSQTWPLLCFEVAFDKGKAKIPAHVSRLPFWTLAEQHGWMEEIPALTPQTLPARIRAEASRNGVTLSEREIALLAQSLPPDAAAIASELARLGLSTDAHGRLPKGSLDALDQLGQSGRELGIFELLRLMQQHGSAPAVWRRILEDRLSGDSMVFAFIAILLREARILWQSLAGSPVPLPWQVAAQKADIARSLGFTGVARLWDIALNAEKGIKSGERQPAQAFEILAADLFVLFGRDGKA